MKNLSRIKERYMGDDLQVRLGGVAANLARIASFSDNPSHREAVEGLLEESKFFIEWTASEATVEMQAELAQLQVELARWHVRLDEDWSNEKARWDMAVAIKDWSETVLKLSGLLHEQEAVGAESKG